MENKVGVELGAGRWTGVGETVRKLLGGFSGDNDKGEGLKSGGKQ